MFFDHCETVESLTAEYRKAAKLNHPDMGGDEETMKKVNAEFAEAMERIRKAESRKGGAKESGNTADLSSDIAEMIQRIIMIDDIIIEVCGSWVWVGGDTFSHRVELREAGYSYSGRKKMWYWGQKKDNRRSCQSMEYIRQTYGSRTVEREGRKRIEA